MTGPDAHARAPCMCFPMLRRKPQDAKTSSQHKQPSALTEPQTTGSKAVDTTGQTLPAKANLAPTTDSIPKAPAALEAASPPASDSIPTATSSASPSSSPPASRLPRSRQASDESQDSNASSSVKARTAKLSQSDPIAISNSPNTRVSRIPTKSASADESVTLVANATGEATADIMIDITNTQLAPTTPAATTTTALSLARAPSKIPSPPSSRSVTRAPSQEVTTEVTVIELPSTPPPHEISAVHDISTTDAAPLDLQKLMQNLPFSISPPSSPTATSSNAAATPRPSSPVTIVNIQVNQYNYQLQPDGTWGAAGCQRTASSPHPSPRNGPIIVEMSDSKQLSRIPSRPMTPPGIPPTRIPSCPTPARTSSLGGSRIPATFAPTPSPPKRLGSAPKKLAITNGSS